MRVPRPGSAPASASISASVRGATEVVEAFWSGGEDAVSADSAVGAEMALVVTPPPSPLGEAADAFTTPAGAVKLVASKTGLVLDPYFSATKIEWLLEHVKGLPKRAKDGDVVFFRVGRA